MVRARPRGFLQTANVKIRRHLAASVTSSCINNKHVLHARTVCPLVVGAVVLRRHGMPCKTNKYHKQSTVFFLTPWVKSLTMEEAGFADAARMAFSKPVPQDATTQISRARRTKMTMICFPTPPIKEEWTRFVAIRMMPSIYRAPCLFLFTASASLR